MKKALILSAFLILVAACLLQLGCKKSTVTTRTVTVTVYEGVSGTPATGIYSYNDGDTIAYSYSLLEGYTGLTVLLDNTAVDATGTITVSGDHILKAYSAGTGEFSLTVTVGTGAAGTPAAGTYTYKEGEEVAYSYSLEHGYADLVVYVDGTEEDASGTITMTKDRTLSVTADKQFDIQGDWTLNEAYADGSSFKVTTTFSGTIDGGTVVDTDGGTGTYTVVAFSVAFKLVFPDVTYLYVGTFSDENTLSGTSTKTDSGGTSYSGSWTATRNSTSAPLLTASGRKGHMKMRFTRR